MINVIVILIVVGYFTRGFWGRRLTAFRQWREDRDRAKGLRIRDQMVMAAERQGKATEAALEATKLYSSYDLHVMKHHKKKAPQFNVSGVTFPRLNQSGHTVEGSHAKYGMYGNQSGYYGLHNRPDWDMDADDF